MSGTQTPSVLVVGGYGTFGAKVVERLARSGDISVIVAGRSETRALEAASAVNRKTQAPVSHAAFDALQPDPGVLSRLAPAVIINASGPYQAQDYSLARAAIATGAHYIDLADARAFVTGIAALDDDARRAGVLVTSGASSVPALAASIIDHYAPQFAAIDSIEHAITPANGFDPGIATTASILGGVGQPMQVWRNGTWWTAYGWHGLRRIDCPGLGIRWAADCDVPDLAIFPQRYAGVQEVRFQAGLEVPLFQFGLWVIGWAVRAGMLAQPQRLAGALLAVKRRLSFLGSDVGGMVVFIRGRAIDGARRRLAVCLIARDNQGPYVPAIPSVVLARSLLDGSIETRGAMPCVGLMRLADFEREVADLQIELRATEAQLPEFERAD